MMFTCERCGSSFSPIRVSSRQNCPRCRARDRVSVPLTLDTDPIGGYKAGSEEFEEGAIEKGPEDP
jgi:predicted  nucleic acid-binding Zn-ribbon protein